MQVTQARVLRLPEVQARIGLGRDSIYRLVRSGHLKAPLKISSRASGWLERDIDSFIAQRVAERDGNAEHKLSALEGSGADIGALDRNNRQPRRAVGRKARGGVRRGKYIR